MERHNTIKYLIDNLHLDTIESKTYIKHLFEFLKLKSEKKMMQILSFYKLTTIQKTILNLKS